MPLKYRYKHWDYKVKGVYMITMDIDGRKPLLGELQGGTGNLIPYSKGKGSHLHLYDEDTKGNRSRKTHDKKTCFRYQENIENY